MEIRDERDIYIAYANHRGMTNQIIFDESTLPFSKRVIIASIDSAIDGLMSGKYQPIHPSSQGSVEKEIDGLQSLALRLSDYVKIDDEDKELVDKINSIGEEALENKEYMKLNMKYFMRARKDDSR
jgi:hypothetical protein